MLLANVENDRMLYTYSLLASLIRKKPNRAIQYMYTLMQPYTVICVFHDSRAAWQLRRLTPLYYCSKL